MRELLPQDQVSMVRRPTVVFTQAYLDDPIRFTPDVRILPETLARQLQQTTSVVRDFADFVEINLSSAIPQLYPVPMHSIIYRRSDINRHIDMSFTQF
jgi:hypothetical protein